MSTITTRAGKGTTLTWAEADANFTNLNTDKAEKAVANTFTAQQSFTGTAATAPAIAGASDPNTGVFFPAADTVGIATGGIANVQFSGGSSPRITGDFSNATFNSRVLFQNSVAASNTNLGVIPSNATGAATISLFNASDATNAARLVFSGNTSDCQIAASITGTGTYLPMTFYTGGMERMRIDTSGNVGVGKTSTAWSTAGNLDVLGTVVMGSAFGFRNKIINGGCQVAQRATSSITSSAQYGQTDRFYVLCSGTGLSGTFTQKTGHGASTATGCSTWAVINVTSGTCYQGHRIEAVNSKTLAGKVATFSCKIYHDFGSTLNFTVAMYKATAVDNFTSVAGLSVTASATVACANSAYTTLSFTTSGPLTADDVVNGLQIQVYNVAAITLVAKSFMIADWQLEEGSVATPFETRPYGLELALCQRYYYQIKGAAQGYSFGLGSNDQTTTAAPIVVFPVTMRAAPTALEQSGTATDYSVKHGVTTTACSSVPTFIGAGTSNALIRATVASGLTVGQAGYLLPATSTAYLGFSAEL